MYWGRWIPRTVAGSVCWIKWLIVAVIVGTASAMRDAAVPQCRLSVEDAGVTAVGREGLRASCTLRTLRSELLQHGHSHNSTLSAVNHSLDITSLHLYCSRQVVFTSNLQPAAFAAFPRLQELNINACKLKDLPDRTFVGLLQLRRLSINTYHQDWPGATLILNRETFTELPRLERLDLSACELWQLPEGSLCELASLNTLNLTNNRIHRMADLGLIANCLAPISHILLSHNEIDEIPSNSLPTPHLHTLHLNNNKLARIDDDAFKSLTEINELILSFNKIVALPQTAFVDLYQLRSLDLANNSITSLPPAIFTSLGQLLALNISHNQLSMSFDNPEPFVGLIRLVVLDLSYNRLNVIGPRIFDHLYSLQVLFISNNKISYLNEGVFSNLANLYTVDISDNMITTLASGTLRGLSVLTHLFLDNNLIITISDKAFYNCSALQKLSITGNRIKQVPKAITHLSRIQVLDLSHNSIDSLERSNLKGLHHLKRLSLNNNFLGNITVDAIPRLAHLKYLDLSHNKIGGVEHRSFEPLKDLVTLNMSHNFLPDINGLAEPLLQLAYLNVSHNKIVWFDYAVIPRNLSEIDLSYNQIKKVENHYEVHDKLKLRKMIATNNNITEISALSIPNGIEIIDFSHNLIDYVSSNTFLSKYRVNEINLEHNFLTLLDESSLRLPPRSPEASSAAPPLLLLSNNPLKCDCGAEWLARAARDANGDKMLTRQSQTGALLPRLGKIMDVKCTLPGLWEEVSVSLVSVHQHQFLCTYRRHCFTLCHCCDFDACDCEQTCPDNCSCYHDHTWTHNIVDCGKQNWTAMPLGVPMDVTEAFLDGNNMGNLTSHALIGRKNLRVLYLNNSNIIDIQNRTFNGLRNLQVLRIDHNYLKALHGFEFILLHNLVELYINDNHIAYISNTTFTSLRSLEILRLENNRIYLFPVWNLAFNPFLVEVGLYHNKWSCECNFLANLKAWLDANRIKASNVNQISCYHNKTGREGALILSNTPGHCDHYVSTTHLHQLIIYDYIMFIGLAFGILLILVISILGGVVYRRRIKLWTANQYSKYLFEKSVSYIEEREKLFDVFVSHSNKDSAWVYGVLIPELEARGYRTCAAYRNCSSSTSPIVAQAMSEGMACSQRLLLVLSRGLVDCEWCKYDFKSTHVEAIRKFSKKQLIIINLEDIPKSEIDSELSGVIKKASFSFKPRDPRFWDRLRRALPSLRHRRRCDDTSNKSISSPLVAVDIPSSELAKFTCHPIKNLTLNPYWETAITSNVPEWNMTKPDLGAPPWVQASPIKNKSSPSSCSPRIVDGEHTYMSVSECDGPNSTPLVGCTIAGPSSSTVTHSTKPNVGAVLTNGTVAKLISGQSSPPLLSLHHQHLVQHRVTHYQEAPQYQTPEKLRHSQHNNQSPLQSSPSTTQTLHSTRVPNAHVRSSADAHRTQNLPMSHNCNYNQDVQLSGGPNATIPNNLDNEFSSPGSCTNERQDSHRNVGVEDHASRGSWIYETPVNHTTSTSGQTYYV
uniref:Toll-like receptor Tollo n=1 Tax=Hirondellea gigas TaxID=1518452 RepID=A0A6A7G1U3_9CRUS